MSAVGSPLTVSVTRSPALTASITLEVRLRRSRTPISMCDIVALRRSNNGESGRRSPSLLFGGDFSPALPRERFGLALARRVGGRGLEHLADLLAHLRRVLVPVRGHRVLGGSLDDLFLLADDRQRAVVIALEAAAVGHYSAHLNLQSVGAEGESADLSGLHLRRYGVKRVASANGLPSESRQIVQRSPGWTTEPPCSRTRFAASVMSVTVR